MSAKHLWGVGTAHWIQTLDHRLQITCTVINDLRHNNLWLGLRNASTGNTSVVATEHSSHSDSTWWLYRNCDDDVPSKKVEVHTPHEGGAVDDSTEWLCRMQECDCWDYQQNHRVNRTPHRPHLKNRLLFRLVLGPYATAQEGDASRGIQSRVRIEGDSSNRRRVRLLWRTEYVHSGATFRLKRPSTSDRNIRSISPL